MSRQGRLGMVEKQLQWTQQPDGEVPTPWGALLLMRGGCMGPSYPFPSQGERKQETVPQLWGCDKLIFSSSKPTAMKKQGPKADPRRGGAVRIGMPRKPGAGEALELQGKGLKTGGLGLGGGKEESVLVLQKWKDAREGAGGGGRAAPSPSRMCHHVNTFSPAVTPDQTSKTSNLWVTIQTCKTLLIQLWL